MVQIEGDLQAAKLKIAFVVARFNEFICEHLLEGALDSFVRHGGNKDSGPFDEEAPIDYRGSAPPGAPGPARAGSCRRRSATRRRGAAPPARRRPPGGG